jgi:serine phosphatase RsbU (regulator of sigma subunit)
MSLRLRLIVAFFALSVVPLGAVTFFTYLSNAEALREAAGHEAESLAGDLTQRMQLVTMQIGERVEHVMEVQQRPAASTAVARPQPAPVVEPAKPVAPAVTPVPAADPAAQTEESVAAALGEVAMLLNNIELRGVRGPPGPGTGPPPPGSPQTPDARGGQFRGFSGERGRRGEVILGQPVPLPSASPGVAAATASAPSVPPVPPTGPPDVVSVPSLGRGGSPPIPPVPAIPGAVAQGPPASPIDGREGRRGGRAGSPESDRRDGSQGRDSRGGSAGADTARAGGPPSSGGPTSAAGEDNRIMFDMMPIRREMIQQLVGSSEEWQKLSVEERQRVIGDVNQRMLGIVQGIQMGAAEMQKKVSAAQQQADEKARAADLAAAAKKAAAVRNRAMAAAAPAARAATEAVAAPSAAPGATAAGATASGSAGPMRRRTALSGSRLDVTVERNGKVVREANAEVNLPNLLATVFTSTRRQRGDVPFAYGTDGKLYTTTDDDRKAIESLGSQVQASAPTGTTVLPDWIVVTTPEPTGSGLKFGIARPVGASLDELRQASARNAGLGLACIGLALIGIVPISSRLTRNLTTLNQGVHRIAEGDYAARVPVGSNDEIGKLARAFNQMAEDVERHQHAMVEQERIRRELELGRQIQHDMLPQGPLRLGLTEIKGVSVPAREVGGDFFNYFKLTDGDLALLVGDVSGKGVGAALLMANIQASLRTRLALGQDLASIAREIDHEIERNTPGAVYATLFVGMLNPDTRVLRYVNAGHNPQYVRRASGLLEQMSSSGLPVGLLAGHGYTEAHLQLKAGDLLFFYTDGCVEAESESGEMFGIDRLETLLIAPGGAEDLLARVETAVKEFRGKAEPFDDATMMVVTVG